MGNHLNRQSRHTLKPAFKAVSYLMAFGLFAGVAFSWFYSERLEAKGELEERFSRRVDAGAEFIGSYLHDVAARQRRYAVTAGFSSSTSNKQIERFVASFDFSAALLLDDNGRLVALSPKGVAEPGEEVASKYPHLAAAVQERSMAVSPVVQSLAQEQPIVGIAVPFKNNGQRLALSGGLYIDRTPLKQYLDGVTTIRGAQARIVDSNGHHVSDTGVANVFAPEDMFTAQRNIPGAPWVLEAAVPSRSLYGSVPGTKLFPYVTSCSVGLIGVLLLFLGRRVRKGRRDLVSALADRDRELRRTIELVHAKEAAEAELRDTLDQTKTLLDQLPVGVMFRDAAGRYAAANEAAVHLFGVPADDLTTWLADDFVRVLQPRRAHDETPISASELPSSAALGGAVIRGAEMVVQTPSEAVKHLSVDAAPIRSHDGDTQGVVAIFTDVSRERALEGEVRQAQKMEAVGRLAGGIAHDFNNLLSVILNYAQFIIDEAQEGDLKVQDVSEIQRAASRGAGVVRQLMSFSRQDVVSFQALDLNQQIAETLRLLETTLGEHIQIRFAPGPTLPKIKGDESQLQQMLLNLAVNAKDAMPQGGVLDISTCSYSNEGTTWIRLDVADSGCGIEPDDLRNIFEPFFTTKRVGEGTGLGLASVYGIMKRVGGDVRVTSTVDVGTTFTLLFPVASETSRLDPQDAGTAVMAGAGARVLVVEDEPGVRKVAERLLRGHGFDVTSFAVPGEALEHVRSGQRFDLLVTDMVMPELGGVELARQVLEVVEVPVVFMTGYSEDILSAYDDLDFQAVVLKKPFTRASLMQSVSEAFRSIEAH